MALELCTLASGSSGNCIYVGGEKSGILIDCGMSGKYILNALMELGVSIEKIKGIIVTHEHSDHISGAGILSRKLKIPIYANIKTWGFMDGVLGKIAPENRIVIDKNEKIQIGDMNISTYSIPHDAVDPVGVCIDCHGKKAAIATDLGYFSQEVFDNIKDADLILLESNHDVEMLKVGSYPYYLKRRILSDSGHLSNEAAGKAVCDLAREGKKQIMLGHLSRENNFPELAYETVKGIIEGESIELGKDIEIEVAPRGSISKIFCA